MAAGSLEHAVEPVFTTKVGTPWAGLGLAATHGIVSRAGGRMNIVSAPGAGTTVHIYLPEHASAQRTSSPGHGDISGVLLIVDDNENLRVLATRLLTKAGFDVLVATGGVEALSVLRNRTVDCLVTDIAMPDMGGIDLADKAGAVDPEMPIVFVSGFVSVLPGPRGPLPVGAHSLTKPYSAEALTSAVRRAIRARQR
jgi:CheY-like chemotaxis protein